MLNCVKTDVLNHHLLLSAGSTISVQTEGAEMGTL